MGLFTRGAINGRVKFLGPKDGDETEGVARSTMRVSGEGHHLKVRAVGGSHIAVQFDQTGLMQRLVATDFWDLRGSCRESVIVSKVLGAP